MHSAVSAAGGVYAGIGSRKTPEPVLNYMLRLAGALQRLGYTLRSGGAGGADSAFAAGVTSPAAKRVYTPWTGFLKNSAEDGAAVALAVLLCRAAALQLAERYHPAWHNCSAGARKLHARNMVQILGEDLRSPCNFVVCWTADGQASGGTGQALRVAAAHGIPVYNLHNPAVAEQLTMEVRRALGSG